MDILNNSAAVVPSEVISSPSPAEAEVMEMVSAPVTPAVMTTKQISIVSPIPTLSISQSAPLPQTPSPCLLFVNL